jgi:hypothetical protein
MLLHTKTPSPNKRLEPKIFKKINTATFQIETTKEINHKDHNKNNVILPYYNYKQGLI